MEYRSRPDANPGAEGERSATGATIKTSGELGNSGNPTTGLTCCKGTQATGIGPFVAQAKAQRRQSMARYSSKGTFIRWALPYGAWKCEDGREVLFDRMY